MFLIAHCCASIDPHHHFDGFELALFALWVRPIVKSLIYSNQCSLLEYRPGNRQRNNTGKPFKIKTIKCRPSLIAVIMRASRTKGIRTVKERYVCKYVCKYITFTQGNCSKLETTQKHQVVFHLLFLLLKIPQVENCLSTAFSTSLLPCAETTGKVCAKAVIVRIIYVLQGDSSGHTPRNYFWILFESCLRDEVREGGMKRASETETEAESQKWDRRGWQWGCLSFISLICQSTPKFSFIQSLWQETVFGFESMTPKLHQAKTVLRLECVMSTLRRLLFLTDS